MKNKVHPEVAESSIPGKTMVEQNSKVHLHEDDLKRETDNQSENGHVNQFSTSPVEVKRNIDSLNPETDPPLKRILPCHHKSVEQKGGAAKRTQIATETKLELLPPTAFLVKKDGTPILEGSNVLPSVYRTDSELEHGLTTLQDNHYAPIVVNPSDNATSLLSPRDFQNDGDVFHTKEISRKTRQQTPQFLSPADEMVHIRNTLQNFKHLKMKYRQVMRLKISFILMMYSHWLGPEPGQIGTGTRKNGLYGFSKNLSHCT